MDITFFLCFKGNNLNSNKSNKDKHSYSQYTLLCRAVVANLISVYVVVRIQRIHVIRNTFSPESQYDQQMPHDTLQTNSLHHEEEQQNIYSNKTYTTIKESNQLKC